MRLRRVRVPARNTAGGAFARRARWLPLISASTAGAFALGYIATVAAHGATVTASEAAGARPTGSASPALAPLGTGVVDPAVKPFLNPKLLKAVPLGPGKVSKPVQEVLTSPAMTTALDADGIPEVALEAYQRAASHLAVSDPACHLPWQLLAAIGRVESDDGRFGGAMLLPNGNTTIPIYGIPLDGRDGVALVRDTTDGNIDGDPNFARAVGPMQFLPSTWASYGADGNGDGIKDINNIFDAALGAADYLCAGGGDMANPAQETAAVLRYNDAYDYVRVVLALEASYQHGDFAAVPTTAGPAQAPVRTATKNPAQTPAPKPTRPPSPTSQPTPPPTPTAQPTPPTPTAPPTPPSPTSQPTPPPTQTTAAPSGSPATTAPPTPAPTDTTEPGPAPSAQPSQAPEPSATPPFQPGQTADIGWAPAMREVVLKLLAAKAAPTRPAGPAHHRLGPSGPSAYPARRTTEPHHR